MMRHPHSRGLAARASLFFILLFAPVAHAEQSILDQLGLAQLKRELGPDVPTGRGIEVGHVEGLDASAYMPDTGDQRFEQVNFIAASGTGASDGHATATCGMIYGSEGLARGVTDVHMFAVRDWLGDGYLRVGKRFDPPRSGIRVFNHSWISDPPGVAAVHVLRRVDEVIDKRGVIMVVGVNNRAASRLPALLGSAYNVIAVGHYDGDSSGGRTRIDGEGRCKPDVVAPGGLTSFATAAVTGMVARLLETADTMGGDAARPQVIKAALLAGCAKTANWSNSEQHPLAEHVGAGRVRIDRSYNVLRRGPLEGRRITSRYGWVFAQIGDAPHQWSFDAPAGAGEASIVAVWHRRAAPAKLGDIDLVLYRLDEQGVRHVERASRSKVDNVEHIYLPRLEPGRYVLEAQRLDDADESCPVAIAWRMER